MRMDGSATALAEPRPRSTYPRSPYRNGADAAEAAAAATAPAAAAAAAPPAESSVSARRHDLFHFLSGRRATTDHRATTAGPLPHRRSATAPAHAGASGGAAPSTSQSTQLSFDDQQRFRYIDQRYAPTDAMHAHPRASAHVYGMCTGARAQVAFVDALLAHACASTCIRSCVWHVHGTYAQVAFVDALLADDRVRTLDPEAADLYVYGMLEHAPRACVCTCASSRVWHVHCMYTHRYVVPFYATYGPAENVMCDRARLEAVEHAQHGHVCTMSCASC